MKMERYINLITEIQKRKPLTIMEIGTWRGVNSTKMIMEARKYNDNIKYYGFDLFDMDEDMRQKELHVKKNATQSEADFRIRSTMADYELIVGNTVETLATFVPDRQIDFVFIDGGHSLETIESDWSNVAKLINFDTVILFDDYYHNREDFGCKPLIQSLDPVEYHKYLLEPKDVTNDLEISIAKVQLCMKESYVRN